MKKTHETKLRDNISKERFFHNLERHNLTMHYSILSKFAVGLMGMMIAFVAAFHDIKILAISFVAIFLLIFVVMGHNLIKQRNSIEKRLTLSEQQIKTWYDELTLTSNENPEQVD